ncbi:hypothetical protein [Sphingobacterium pedocola]|nr:hypothetical protein [Sphingobacterium pedocola]
MARIIESEMLNYFTQLNDAEKKSVVQMLKTFIKGRKEGEQSINIEQYNAELMESEAEFERGEYITHEQLLAAIKEW